MSKKTIFCLVIISLISISSTALLFADCVWTGAGDTNNWSNAANWDTNAVPQSTDSVIFDGTNNEESRIDAGFDGTIASITINGYTGNIHQERSLTITGDYSQSSGGFSSPPDLPFSVSGSFFVSQSFSADNRGGFDRSTGIGTIDNPILIYDVYGLQGMESWSNATAVFKLNSNIDASVTINWNGGQGFLPIGGTTGGGMFQANFDGNGHTISNLYINITDPTQANVGLFGYTHSTIKNLGLVNCSITGPANTGHIDNAGVGSITGYNHGNITNCYNTGSVSGGIYNEIGGLAGVNGGAISDCYNTGNISGSYAGGLVGRNYGAITNCYNTGNISVDIALGSAGGLVGNENRGTISKCYNAGNVSAGGYGEFSSGGYVGGLVVWNRGPISDCYNTGSVSQIGLDGWIGGLVGQNMGGSGIITNSYNAGSVSGHRRVGGLVGYDCKGQTYNSYSIGVIFEVGSAHNDIGGFIGGFFNYEKSIISNCGWWTGACALGSGPPLTHNESDKLAFTNPSHGVYIAVAPTWDFSVWSIYANESYPFLRWQVPAGSWTLNMTDMNWYQNTASYSSTGAAVCEMILNYIRKDVTPTPATLTQNEIYEYGKGSPAVYGPELTPNEVDKALGHFDPYDYLVSNWSDGYDPRPDGNPYQGYNFSVDTYNPASDLEAINKYMRDICHWMAYSVTKEDWWKDGDLVIKPNTPAAIPIYGSYSSWVAVKGCATSANPCPEPHTNPWNTPDFTVYGFWMKDPRLSGIGENTFKTAAECRVTYFLPLKTDDAYKGLFLQVAEPPAEMSKAIVEIPRPIADPANLDFIKNGDGFIFLDKNLDKNEPVPILLTATSKPLIKKQSWRDLVDPHLLTDPEAVAAFEGAKMGKSVFVDRLDGPADYYLAPFYKRVKGKSLLSAVIILDASVGYFKEASWTDKPGGELLNVDKRDALRLVRNRIRKDLLAELKGIPKKPAKNYLLRQRELLRKYSRLLHDMKDAEAILVWKPNSYSPSPYSPYWKIDIDGHTWYVTQEGKVIP